MKNLFAISCSLGIVFMGSILVKNATSNEGISRAERAAIATYTCNKLSRFLENDGRMLDTKKLADEKNIEFAKDLFEKKGCK